MPSHLQSPAEGHSEESQRHLAQVREVERLCKLHRSEGRHAAKLRADAALAALGAAGADFDTRAGDLLDAMHQNDPAAPLEASEYKGPREHLAENLRGLLAMEPGEVWQAISRADAEGDASLVAALDLAPAVHKPAVEQLLVTFASDPNQNIGMLRRRIRERTGSVRLTRFDNAKQDLRALVTAAHAVGREIASLYGPALDGHRGHVGFYQRMKEAESIAFAGIASAAKNAHLAKIAEFNNG